MPPNDFPKDWYQIIHDGSGRTRGGGIVLPESRDEVVRPCSLCSQFLNEWQPSNINLYLQTTGYTSTRKSYHHQTLSELVQSVTSGCDLCIILLFAFVDFVENGTKPSALVPDTRLRVDPTKIPNEPVAFRLEPSQRYRFIFVISFPRPTVPDIVPSYGFQSPTLDYYHLSLCATIPSRWRAHIIGNDPDNSPHLTLPDRTDVQTISASVRSMMRYCHDKHPQCGQSTADPGFMPLRLVDVSKIAENQVRIVETSSMVAQPYVALSYCWGPSEEFRLKKSNYTDCLLSIPAEKLPQTLLDATRFTHALGFQYIWIDAICIIQDDAQDWAFEAVRMRQVYQAADLCISALLSPSSVHGLFPKKRDWAGIRVALGEHREEFVLQVHDFSSEPSSYILNTLEDSPMSSRGWTMQERFLSRKIVHIDRAQIMYECRRLIMPETGLVLEDDDEEALSLQKLYSSLYTAPRPRLLLSWYHMIYEYGMRHFKHESDRLTALDGVRQLFQPGIDCLYWNGLWTSDLYTGLLWVKVEGPMGSPCRTLLGLGVPVHPGLIKEDIPPCIDFLECNDTVEFDEQPAPSPGHLATWSWASSLPGQLYFLLRDNGAVMETEDDEESPFTQPRDPTKLLFQILKAGHLRLDVMRPFLRVRGVLLRLKQSKKSWTLHFGLPDVTTFHCRASFLPDKESLTELSLDCSGLVVSQADVRVPDEKTQTWVRMCTLTIIVLKQSVSIESGLTYERLGVIFFQGESLSDLMDRRRHMGEDEFCII